MAQATEDPTSTVVPLHPAKPTDPTAPERARRYRARKRTRKRPNRTVTPVTFKPVPSVTVTPAAVTIPVTVGHHGEPAEGSRFASILLASTALTLAGVGLL